MSAHLSRLRLFQRLLRSLVWVWVWVWDWIHSHTSPRTRSTSSRHPPFTHNPFSPRSLVCGGQTSPHKPRLVVSHSTCPPLSSSPHAHIFVLGTAVINNNFSHSDSARRVRQISAGNSVRSSLRQHWPVYQWGAWQRKGPKMSEGNTAHEESTTERESSRSSP
jgi:hypothetical protein